MDKIKYYNLSNILATKSDYNLIIGQRSNGKTYAVCKYMLETYKKNNTRFAYVRRWADDIKGYRAEQLFYPLASVIESLFGSGFTVQYYRHKYYLCNENNEKIDVIGYSLALSESSHTKSVSYTNVKTILFDEFIQMQGESMLRDELPKFENTLSTLIRQNTDVKIFMLANTVSKFSPYFVHFGIDINKVEQGSITTKEYPLDDEKGLLRVSLEYCEFNKDIGKRTSKYTTSKMISTGKWEIPETDDIPSVVGEIVKDKLVFTIYDPDSDITIGCFLRRSKWITLEQDEETLIYKNIYHVREFLILKVVNKRSSYFHLTNQKALNYNTFNDLTLFLKSIYENTDINFENELYMGRVFSDNMFTADYFNHAWKKYGMTSIRDLL